MRQRKRRTPKRAAKAGETLKTGAAVKQPAALGVRVRHARMVRGMTLKELADETRCSESMLSKIENDKAAPSFATLHRVAGALGTRACVQLSRIIAAAICTPARKFLASLS